MRHPNGRYAPACLLLAPLLVLLMSTPCSAQLRPETSWSSLISVGVLSGQRGFSQFGPALPDKTQLGIAVTLGMRYQSGSDAALKATVGYESLNFGSDKALVFQHAPIELISSLKVAPQLWLGWGLRRTVKAELSGSTQPARHLASNTGLVLEATIPILVKPPTRLPPEGRTERDAVGLRYVRESYRDTVSGISLNAPHISLFFQGYWE